MCDVIVYCIILCVYEIKYYIIITIIHSISGDTVSKSESELE